MTDYLIIAGQPNPLDEFRFPWSNGTVDVLKIAGQPNGIDALKIAGTLSNDEALRVVTENESETEYKKGLAHDYDDYFGEMELTNAEVEDRKKTADELEKVFLFMLALLLLLRQKKIDVPSIVIEQLVIIRFNDAMKKLKIEISLVRKYIDDFVPKVVASSLRNISNPFSTTTDRAKSLAENEANSIHNTLAFQKAVAKGCQYKIWRTMRDERVRHTHSEVDNIRIGINDKFVVGDCLMRYPHDTENGTADQINNCRCTIDYK